MSPVHVLHDHLQWVITDNGSNWSIIPFIDAQLQTAPLADSTGALRVATLGVKGYQWIFKEVDAEVWT